MVAIYGFFEIISRYGLGTLMTRRWRPDKNQSEPLPDQRGSLRTLLWAMCMPLMALVVVGYRLWGDRGRGEINGAQEIEALVAGAHVVR